MARRSKLPPNPFPFSDDNKRYHSWNYYLRHTFGEKLCKVPINAGFTCPNIDGCAGYGGCSYCSASGSGDFAGNPCEPIAVQYEKGLAVMQAKWQDARGIAYFQAHTNTYAPVETLRAVYGEALKLPELAGISIATRADCLPPEVLELLSELNQRTFLTVELGLQTVSDETAKRIGRGHDYAAFLEGFTALKQRGIKVCVHIIDGLPGEDRAQMLDTAREMARIKPDFLKIHLLHIMKQTRLAEEYQRGEFEALTFDEYVHIVCDQLELLPPEMVIQRLTGDAPRSELIAPLWSTDKKRVLNAIDSELQKRNSFQGSKYII